MYEDISMIRQQLWAKMRDKEYRENFVAAQLSTGIAAQLVTMRERRGWSQKLVAERTGMAPARVSVMENPSYEKFTLTTLKRIASAFDVALIVRFVPFSHLAEWVSDLSPEKLDAVSYSRDRMNVETQRIFQSQDVHGKPATQPRSASSAIDPEHTGYHQLNFEQALNTKNETPSAALAANPANNFQAAAA